MSRIGSMVKNVTRQVEQKVDSAKKVVEKKAKQVERSTDAVHALYDAGAKKSNRTTLERSVTVGQRYDDRFADGSEAHGLAGAQARVFAQKAATVVSAGGDAFVGVKQSQTERSRDGSSTLATTTSEKLGAEVRGSVFAGTQTGFKVAGQAGAELQLKEQRRHELPGGKTLKHDSTTTALWGAAAKLGAQVGTVTGAEAELFAGVRSVREEKWAASDGQKELAGLTGRAGVMLGVGVLADVEGGYDVDEKQLRLKGDAGVALGVGATVGGEVTVGGADE